MSPGNGNGTAGLRAHAFINGPWTVLDTGYGHETFMHEFGHIFGALDEYCPDACNPPTSIAGYLGVYNANAQAQPGAGGIDDGHGEAASSLMIYNQPRAKPRALPTIVAGGSHAPSSRWHLPPVPTYSRPAICAWSRASSVASQRTSRGAA